MYSGGMEQFELPIDESDDWSDEDLRDCTINSMRQFEEEHGVEDWGGLIVVDESMEWSDQDIREWMAAEPEALDAMPPAIPAVGVI
jgi:hypothetical protein